MNYRLGIVTAGFPMISTSGGSCHLSFNRRYLEIVIANVMDKKERVVE